MKLNPFSSFVEKSLNPHVATNKCSSLEQSNQLLTPFFENVSLSQSSLLHSKPKSTVGTPAYIAPEVLSRREYDGKVSALICSSLLIIALQLGYLTIYCTLFLNLLFASTMLVCCASLLSDTLWLWRWQYRSSPSVWKHHLHWHVAPVLLKFLPCGPASWNPSKSVVLEFCP